MNEYSTQVQQPGPAGSRRALKSTLVALAMASLLAVAGSASAKAESGDRHAAQRNAETEPVVISYAPEELESRSAAEALYERIVRTARDFCSYDGQRSAVRRVQATRCRTDIITQAVARIGAASLNEVHRAFLQN